MAASTLTAGNVAVVGYNTDDPSGTQADTITVVLLAAIGSGTQIYFTDRSWNGTVFGAAGGGEGTYTYTAGVDMAAGTVITLTTAQLSGAGINLSDAGETLYVYQGTNANTPTRFLYAVDMADGNATFNGSLTNTGLTNGATAVAVAGDNANFAGRGHNIQVPTLLQSISTSTNWVYNDNSPQAPITGNFFTAPDQQLWVAASGGGHALAHVDRDGAGNYTGFHPIQIYQNSADNGGTPLVAEGLWHPTDIFIDSVNRKMFVADSDGSGHNRILQFDLAQVLANPGVAPVATILYQDANVGTGIVALQADIQRGLIYFGSDTRILRVDYDTANQTPEIAAHLGTNIFVQDFVADLDANGNGAFYIVNSRIQSVFGADNVSRNFIYTVTGVTPTSTTPAGTANAAQMAMSPNDAGVGGVASTNGDPEAFPKEYGAIKGIDIDPVTHRLYFTTSSWSADHDEDGGATPTQTQYGGVWSYDTVGNPTGVYANVFRQDGVNGPDGLLYYIHVDPLTGRYYVGDITGGPGVAADDQDVWVGALAGGVPTRFQTIANINGLTGLGMVLETAPTLTGSALGATITEAAGNPSANPTAVQPANNFQTTDPDSTSSTAQLVGAQVRISVNFQSGSGHQDQLTINGVTSGTIELGANDIAFSYNSSTGLMTLTGAQTFDNYEAALALVRYRVDGDNPTNYGAAPSRTLAYSTFDGLLYSDEVLATVSVVGVNDAPINGVPGAQTPAEDGSRTFNSANGNLISTSDVDADPAAQALSVTLSVANGTLTLSGTAGLSFSTGDGTADATLAFTGTANAVNTALNGLIYTPTSDYHGADLLTLTVNDQGFNGNDPGLTGAGTSEQDSDTIAITVSAGVDIADDSVTVIEDSVTNTLDLLANDSFENAGRAITAVSAAANGTVTINDNGTPGDATDDFVVYTPDANHSGADSFTYTVTSGGATETATVNVTVTEVNDPPEGADETAVIDQDEVYAFAAADFGFNDTDGDSLDAVIITTLPANGVIYLDVDGAGAGVPAAVTAGQSIDAQYLDGRLTYIPDAGENGAPFDTFTFQVVDDGGVADGGVDTDQSANTFTFDVNPPPYDAVDDAVSTDEDAVLNGDVFADNGSGADAGGPTVSAVNGQAGDVGQEIALASGALLTLNADGTFTYDPNGAFDLAAPGSGAANTSDTDSFTYTINGADTATVTVTVNGVEGDDVLEGDAGPDVITAGTGADTINAGDGDDAVSGGDGNDTVNGGDGSDKLSGDAGNDTINGGIGDDRAYGGSGKDVIDGGDGADRLYGGDDNDAVGGGDGNDLLYGEGGSDKLNGGAGSDKLYGGDGSDRESGGDGDDRVYGGVGNDVLNGDAGADFLSGEDGKDILNGGADNDTLNGGADNDQLNGDAGDDRLDGGANDDRLNGGDGDDWLIGGTGKDVLAGDGGADYLSGGDGDDTLGGGDGDDELYGNAGVDLLHGGAGDDLLHGGAGNDRLTGSSGEDRLIGGTGHDLFLFTAIGDSTVANSDQVVDFYRGDVISVQQIDADLVSGGDQAFVWVSAFTNTTGEATLSYDARANITILALDQDGDAVADFQLLITGQVHDTSGILL